jgi:plastocyanin
MFTNTIVVLASALAMVSAAPTSTTPEKVSRTVTLTGTTHSVVVGRAGLHFDPENVVAEVGDVVEWHYLPKNRKHSP